MPASDTTTHQAATYAYAGALIDELGRAGVRHACLCPGSRSTPLALTLAAQSAIKAWVHVDERSAAYFALGLARATGTPVALVCTSGTAAANFLPAIVEARYARVPLLALTADRPPELRDVGAPQAIDQIHLYCGHVKWFVEMALPEATEPALRYARTTAARAVATALEGPAGPVHLNLPFREPLTPPPDWPGREPETPRERGSIETRPRGEGSAQFGDRPYTAIVTATRGVLSSDLMKALADEVAETQRGVIVCGPRPDPTPAPAIMQLAYALRYPVLADPLSGVRCGPHHDRLYVLDAYDAIVRDEHAEALTPDLVLRFGAPPTSKALQTFLQGVERQIVFDADGGWRDPSSRASVFVHADPRSLSRTLALKHHATLTSRPTTDGWDGAWHAVNVRARNAIRAYLDGLDEPFEGKVFAELAALLPDGATLFVGNSMPVRDLDSFFPGSGRRIRFLANRGANGIDGVVSSALGAAATGGGPLVLAIGDLSFYHDLNGLLAARRHGIDATIVLLHNDGGGIFSFLPQAADPMHFEELFGTPTGLDFRLAVEMYGCGFRRAETWPAFREAVAASLAASGVQVIELRTDRARNVALHRAVWEAVAEAVWCD